MSRVKTDRHLSIVFIVLLVSFLFTSLSYFVARSSSRNECASMLLGDTYQYKERGLPLGYIKDVPPGQCGAFSYLPENSSMVSPKNFASDVLFWVFTLSFSMYIVIKLSKRFNKK